MIIEHDFVSIESAPTCLLISNFLIVIDPQIMATYLADRVIVYEGQPGVHAVARK